ncbi:MAG: FtsQ-type POTRA domain-containing protein [Patescibacteria group bacterium]|nr:FtsQ-type POTRA domain-containing protein [Patescibacteria group bacterium]
MLKGKPQQNIKGRARRLKYVKKDYQHKNLNNPFFRQRQKKKSSNHKSRRLIFLILIFLLLLGSALFYLFFLSNNFLIKKIEVNGLTRSSDDDLVTMAWTQSEESKLIFLKQTNLLSFNTNKLQADLSNNFSFARLEVKKKWPHTLVINLEERALAFIWQDSSGAFFSDRYGCLVTEVSPIMDDFKNYPVLTPIIQDDYILANNCLDVDDGFLSSMLSLSEKLGAYDNLGVKDYILESEFNTLTINLTAGPKVYFNIKNELDKQVKKLEVIEREKPEDEFKALEYIDLRYGDRVYFK